MIKVTIVFDDRDQQLGQFFEEAKNGLMELIQYTDISKFDVREVNADSHHILNSRITDMNSQKFLFFAYSHGNEDSLAVNGSDYVKVGYNTNMFTNSLFYSVSCLTGKILGESLIKEGCLSFIGYSEDLYVCIRNIKLSIKCANAAMNVFFAGETTIGESVSRMRNLYNTEIDKLCQYGDTLTAAHLTSNRDALICLGDKQLTIRDFILNI